MITKEQLQAMSFDEVLDELGRITDSYISINNVYEDVMQLAFERGISIIKADGANLWLAMYSADGESVFRQSEIMVQDESPLRAIACCLILVLQGEKE